MFGSRWISDGTTCCLLTLVLGAGCTTVLGIDGNYVPSSGTATPPGGQGGDIAVDAASNGGDPSSAGGAESSGGGTPASLEGGACATVCTSTEKCCSRSCVAPSPLSGCSSTACSPCAKPPDHAESVCNGEACGFKCATGYATQGQTCSLLSSSGGAGGGGSGAGGKPATCDPGTCPVCPTLPTLPFQIYEACCQSNGKCGCELPASACSTPPVP